MSHAARRELAYRNQNGLEVALLWQPRSNEVSVEVIDHLDDSGFRQPPDDYGDRLPQTISAE
jgi:hypothetical protein